MLRRSLTAAFEPWLGLAAASDIADAIAFVIVPFAVTYALVFLLLWAAAAGRGRASAKAPVAFAVTALLFVPLGLLVHRYFGAGLSKSPVQDFLAGFRFAWPMLIIAGPFLILYLLGGRGRTPTETTLYVVTGAALVVQLVWLLSLSGPP